MTPSPAQAIAGPSRRGFLASGGALALGGCAHCRFPEPYGTASPIGDAHAHFFNAADLPVAGFAKFVLIPRHFPGFPPYADALVDIIAFVAKLLTLTASQEARQLGSGTLSLRTLIDTRAFARKAAQAHRLGLAGRAASEEVDRLEHDAMSGSARASRRRDSHRALAALLSGRGGAEARATSGLSEDDFVDILEQTPAFSANADGASDLQCPGATAQRPADAAAEAGTLLRWAYLMCQPRCVHVEAYLDTISRDVSDAINLLVDYDKWLNDSPRRGSEQPNQVAYWTRYSDISAQVPGRIRLQTFAGFDPLRDADERVLQSASRTTLNAMKQWAIDGRNPASRAPLRISGFKVYPPMGFRPDSNTGIDIPPARGGVEIHRRWGDRFPEIGAEIDRSLTDFFSFCVMEDIPVLTHGRESNIAFDQHGDDPSPRHWLNLVDRLKRTHPGKPLRLCIGHFDMFNCPDSPKSDREVLREALLLNRDGKAQIYFDVGFDDRILAGQGADLFSEIADVCATAGDDGDYVLFGSDWIMLANQANANAYLALARAAASAVDFWRAPSRGDPGITRMEKLFGLNLRRFLTPLRP